MVPRYSRENFPNILKIVDGLKEVGKKHSATAGQVALAWVLAQGADVIPIPGTSKIKVLFLVVRIQVQIAEETAERHGEPKSSRREALSRGGDGNPDAREQSQRGPGRTIPAWPYGDVVCGDAGVVDLEGPASVSRNQWVR
jgi:hypothetical protein